MGLRKSHGNMYDWVTHMHTHLGGECPHRCSYCYVGRGRSVRLEKYKGPIRLIESELSVKYGSGKVIFIEHMNDLFAQGVPAEFIESILGHCREYPGNEYVFQTKNPVRANIYQGGYRFPTNCLIGTTIETNRDLRGMSKAPDPYARYRGILKIREAGARVFVTVEPIMDLDPQVLALWLWHISPEFVNIGADSKGGSLPEPSKEYLEDFVAALDVRGVKIRKKTNLDRILKAGATS